jgi:hypothetical protein
MTIALACGGSSQPCCATGNPCNSPLSCQSGTCQTSSFTSPVCGNGTCESGEDFTNCFSDCNPLACGGPGRLCCGGLAGVGGTCATAGYSCIAGLCTRTSGLTSTGGTGPCTEPGLRLVQPFRPGQALNYIGLPLGSSSKWKVGDSLTLGSQAFTLKGTNPYGTAATFDIVVLNESPTTTYATCTGVSYSGATTGGPCGQPGEPCCGEDVCDIGHCVADPSGRRVCIDPTSCNPDCPAGETCVAGVCVPDEVPYIDPSPMCEVDDDCPAKHHCTGGSCVPTPDDIAPLADPTSCNPPCLGGFECAAGVCVPNIIDNVVPTLDPSALCDSVICPLGETCAAGVCAPSDGSTPPPTTSGLCNPCQGLCGPTPDAADICGVENVPGFAPLCHSLNPPVDCTWYCVPDGGGALPRQSLLDAASCTETP